MNSDETAEAVEEVVEAEEETAELESSESDKVCPICTTKNPSDTAICSACEYVFE